MVKKLNVMDIEKRTSCYMLLTHFQRYRTKMSERTESLIPGSASSPTTTKEATSKCQLALSSFHHFSSLLYPLQAGFCPPHSNETAQVMGLIGSSQYFFLSCFSECSTLWNTPSLKPHAVTLHSTASPPASWAILSSSAWQLPFLLQGELPLISKVRAGHLSTTPLRLCIHSITALTTLCPNCPSASLDYILDRAGTCVLIVLTSMPDAQ